MRFWQCAAVSIGNQGDLRQVVGEGRVKQHSIETAKNNTKNTGGRESPFQCAVSTGLATQHHSFGVADAGRDQTHNLGRSYGGLRQALVFCNKGSTVAHAASFGKWVIYGYI